VANGSATFEGVKSTINSIDYLPELITTDDGKTWYIRRLHKDANANTHNAVMGMLAGMVVLSAGNDFIGSATEGLFLPENTDPDGLSLYAKMGGGKIRQETGSHVNTNTWNAILALGRQNKKERGTMEYGAFFEYGRGNYSTHTDDSLRGDGSAHYTGGGLLAKWTAKSNVYVEGSFRAGSLHDNARDVLRAGDGTPFSYETSASYFGAHVGVGRIIPLSNGNSLDVYGRYFYNRRSGVNFTAGDNFSLDAVTSQKLRIGARYVMKRDKWDFYGGIAYEHELDGRSAGTVNDLAIRSADTRGGSFRGELGAMISPAAKLPLTLDLNLTGYAGKKRGVTGSLSLLYKF